MKRYVFALVTLFSFISLSVSSALLSSFERIPSTGLIYHSAEDIYSPDFMLQRFYTGARYRTIARPEDYPHWGPEVTYHYARREGYTFINDNGTLNDTDPSGIFTGGVGRVSAMRPWGVKDETVLYDNTRMMITGAKYDQNIDPEGNDPYVLGTDLWLETGNPTAYPVIPIYDLWFYNFETVPYDAWRNFLGNWSVYISTLDVIIGRKAWLIFSPAWEFNQYATGARGSGWGNYYYDLRGWNIPAEDGTDAYGSYWGYKTQIQKIVQARNDASIDNILIAVHALPEEHRFDPYAEGLGTVDILGFSGYCEPPPDKAQPEWRMQTITRNGDLVASLTGSPDKPLFIIEYSLWTGSGYYPTGAFVDETYSLLSKYPKIKALSWWGERMSGLDVGFYPALVNQTAWWNAYSGS